MTKLEQSPGAVLTLFIRAYDLNPTSLAKQLKLSQATVRLLTMDKTKISVHIALRLAKFFDMKPEYFLNLQNTYDLGMAANNAKIKAVLQSIPKAVKPDSSQDAVSLEDVSFKKDIAVKPVAVKAAGKKAATGKGAKAKVSGKKESRPKAAAGKGTPRGRHQF